MEIFQYTAKKISVFMTIIVFFCLISVAFNVKIIHAANDDESEKKECVKYADVGNAVNSEHENCILIKERQRTESIVKYDGLFNSSVSWNIRYRFDIHCKVAVSECKVRQGIFYYKLQSDGDEHPC